MSRKEASCSVNERPYASSFILTAPSNAAKLTLLDSVLPRPPPTERAFEGSTFHLRKNESKGRYPVITSRQPAATLRERTPLRFNLSLILAVIVTASLLGASAFAANPLPLINAPLVPGQKAPGSASFTLNVTGTGFVSGATVLWNGNARTTTFVSSAQLSATINAADVATAGTANVTVSNPAPGGGSSNMAHFQVVKGGFTVAYSKLDYATDTTPQDAVSADFNRDGIADLAVATGNNTVSVLLGAGNGTFPTHVEYPVPGHPSAILVGDFNGDGKLDIATVDPYQSEITILLGNGDGTFQIHQEYPTGNHPVGFATADLNGDGKLDIVVADYADNKVAVLLGNGDGTFQPHVDYATGNGPTSVAIGDFNGDDKLDLVVANNGDNTAAILLGNGDGTFQGPHAYPTATVPNCIAVGDLSNNGKLDLVVGTSNKAVSVLMGNGDGTFQNHKEYSIGANAVEVVVADLSADGKLDVISANYNDNTVSVLVGNGDGTFKGESIFPTSAGPSGLTIGDFKGDGKLDIVAAASNANTVSVLTDSPISLTPNILAFGSQKSGDPVTKTITLKNNGTLTYTVGTIGFIGTFTSDFKQTNTCGTTVAAGKTCTFSVTFLPTASEMVNVQMTLTATNGSVIAAQMLGQGNIQIYLAPRTMIFSGYTLVGTKSAGRTDTFTNESGVNIYFTNIDLEGVNQSEFSFTSTCAGGGPPFNYSIPLLPGASCTSTIFFSPTQSGGANTAQIYYGNFTLAKQGLLISANGTAVKVTPPSINFGNIKVGATGTGVVTFQNAGSTAMQIYSATFTNGTANVFSIQSNTCNFVVGVGGSVPANSSCTFTLAFTPTVTGTQTATFNIGDADPAPATVALSGTGD